MSDILRIHTRADPDLRLVCVPFAGRGASVYARWPRLAPEWLEVAAVQLPGRENRLFEAPPLTVDDAVRATVDALEDLELVPTALFGHSLGAAVAYEVTCTLAACGAPPVALVVSGCVAPHRRGRRRPVHHLPDAELVDHLVSLGGFPTALLDDADALDMLLPVVRSDLRMAAEYRREPPIALDVPCFVYGAVDDPLIPNDDDVDAWDEVATRGITRRRFRGGHLYLVEHAPEVMQTLVADLRPCVPARAGVDETPWP